MAPLTQRKRLGSKSLRLADRDPATNTESSIPFFVWLKKWKRSELQEISGHDNYGLTKRDRKNRGGRKNRDDSDGDGMGLSSEDNDGSDDDDDTTNGNNGRGGNPTDTDDEDDDSQATSNGRNKNNQPNAIQLPPIKPLPTVEPSPTTSELPPTTTELPPTTTELPPATTEITQAPPARVSLEHSTVTVEPSTVTAEPATVTAGTSTIVLVSTVMTTPVVNTATLSTTFIPPMTSVNIATISSQPRKGVNDPTELLPIPSSTESESATLTTGTALANFTPAGSDRDLDSKDVKHHKGKDGLSKTAEDVLIGAGSIGTFIVICLIGWLVYRMMKKPSGRKFQDKLSAKLAWIPGWNRRPWARIEEPVGVVADLPYSGKPHGPDSSLAVGAVADLPHSGKPRIPSSSMAGADAGLSYSGKSGIAASSLVSVRSLHQPSQSISSNLTAQELPSEASLTIRSRMPDPFFNQSELARQPSDAYNPTRRQVYRASELSSLSSGFGDGDIIIPESLVRPPPQAAPNLRQSNNLVGRFSYQSRSGNNRDTVYTQSSEDSPARFRSVTSWVNQQTGRIKRAQQRAQDGEEVPPVPDLPGVPGVPVPNGLPPEPQYTMMLDDEEPRRADPPTKS